MHEISCNTPARRLMASGRNLAETDQQHRIPEWLQNQSPEMKDTWQYWAILGDHATSVSDHDGATRAYWESTRRNRDVAEVALKLAMSAPQVKDPSKLPANTESILLERAELLSRFIQEKERFNRTGKKSNEAVASMCTILAKLGRLREAEAWAALAITKPDEDIEKVKAIRNQIVKQIAAHPGWRADDQSPYANIDLSFLPLPKMAQEGAAELHIAVKNGTSPNAKQDAAMEKAKSDANKFVASKRPRLSNRAAEMGIDHQFSMAADHEFGVPVYKQMESGGCAIDFDLDGWPDLYLAGSRGTPGEQNSMPNHLYRNVAGQFIDCTEVSGTNDFGFAQGVTYGDLNEDGFPDLMVLNYGRDQVFINNTDGTFSRSNDWLPDQDLIAWSTNAAIADFNSDGISDVFVTRYCDGMEAVTKKCKHADSGKESPCLPTGFRAGADSMMVGTNQGGLRDVTEPFNLNPSQPGRGMGLVVGNLDGEKGVEIFVANDMTANHLWSTGKSDTGKSDTGKSDTGKTDTGETDNGLQQSDDGPHDSPSFVESATLRGLAFDDRFRSQACMGVATADLDEDGDIDFFVTNFDQEHNTLFEQTRPGVWTDNTSKRGIRDTSFSLLGFGCQAIDLDNDGHLEIAIANGHVLMHAEAPSSYQQRMQILFRKTPTSWDEFSFDDDPGYLSQRHVGRGMWTTDANRDGQLDIAITHQTEPFALLINQSDASNAAIRVRLIGTRATRDPVGSSLKLKLGDSQKIAIWTSGDGFYCRNENLVQFGIGKLQSQESRAGMLEVQWPGGTTNEFTVQPNREYVIIEGEDAAYEIGVLGDAVDR